MPKLVIHTSGVDTPEQTAISSEEQKVLVARKLVRANPDDTNDEYKPSGSMNTMLLNKVSQSIAANIRDNRTIMELLPDTRAIFTLMVSTIKSPNTLIGSNLRFEEIEKPAGVAWDGDPIEILEDWLNNTYNFDSKLSKILWDCLCWKGSYPILVLPETTIDSLINGKPTLAGEDFENDAMFKHALPYNLSGQLNQKTVKNIGILSEEAITKAVSLPAYTNKSKMSSISELFEHSIKTNITFSDNIDVFKRPKIQKELTLRGMQKNSNDYTDKSKVNKESETPTNLFAARRFKQNPLLTLLKTNPEDKGIGNGIIIDLPAEATIPINDLVYAVLLDGVGNPICLDNYTSEYESIKDGVNFGSETGIGGGLIRNVRETYKGSIETNGLDGVRTTQELNEDYGKIFDRVIMDVLTGSDILGDSDGFKLPDMEQIHMIGVMRALRGMKTTIMIVPAHLITYFHFEKNTLGVGESLLTRNRFLASQRITIRLANQLSRVTNSIPRREVLMHIDEDEKEASQVAEMMRTACIDDMQNEYSIGKIDSRDIVSSFVKANTTVRAIHKDLPTHNIEVKDFVRSVGEVDSRLDEELKGDWAKALDTQPELVDEFFKSEFAIEHITRNTMYTKSIIEKQHIFEPQITKHIKQLCYFYPQLYSRLRDSLNIKSSYEVEAVLEYIIESISVKLPRPEQAEMDSTYKGFKEVSMFITSAIESIVDEDMLYRLMDEEFVNTDGLKALRMQLEMICRREWLTDGTITIVRRLLDKSEDGAPAIDITELLNEHNENIITNLGDMAKRVMSRSKNTNAKLAETRDDLEKEIAALKAKKEAAEAEANGTAVEETPVDETGTPPTEDTGIPEPEGDPTDEEPIPTEEPVDETTDESTEPTEPTDETTEGDGEEEIDDSAWNFKA